jgi:integrase
MAKRTSGEGTIYKTDRGKFRAQLAIHGKRRSATRDTARECREWLREQREKQRLGMPLDATQMTVDEYLDGYMSKIAITHAASTVSNAESFFRLYVRPRLGSIKMSDLDSLTIQGVVDFMLDYTDAHTTLHVAYRYFKTALNRAVDVGLLHHNPMNRVDVPRPKSDDRLQVWDEAQVQRYFLAIDEMNSWYGNIFKVAVITGIRIGEIIALQWQDIDFDAQTISISRQAARGRKGGKPNVFVPLKTKFSNRTIQVGNLGMNALRHQKELLFAFAPIFEPWNDHDLVFPSKKGNALRRDCTRRHHKNMEEAAGLDHIRFHDLRHTAISMMLSAGIPIIEVARYAGHSNVTTTLDVYGHFIPSHSRAASVMDELLTPVELPQ